MDNIETFSSVTNFSTAFGDGLASMLEHPGLGVFILVCANAGFDQTVNSRLAPRLRQRFEDYSRQYRDALLHGRTLSDADDDVLIFLKLMAIGFDALQPTQRRYEGAWELQFNQLRAFRPPPHGTQPSGGLARAVQRKWLSLQ